MTSESRAVTRKFITEVLEEAKENSRRLSHCTAAHHAFELIVGPGGILNAQYRCKHCQGRIRGVEHHWYQLGLHHGINVGKK